METIGYLLHIKTHKWKWNIIVYNVAERPTIKLQKADLLSASQIKELLVHTSFM